MPLPTFEGELRTGPGDRGADDGAPLEPGAEVAAGAERSVVAVVVELAGLTVTLAVELLPLAPGFAPVSVERCPASLAGRPAGLRERPAGLPGRGRLVGESLSATNRPENAAAKDGSVRDGRGEDGACG